MQHFVRRMGRGLAVVALITGAAIGVAQDQPATPSQQAVSLDLTALIGSPQVFQSVDDPVWQIDAQAGRRLMQLPIRLMPVAEDVVLENPPIDLRGGRFIAWRIGLDESGTEPRVHEAQPAPHTTETAGGWRSLLQTEMPDDARRSGPSGPTGAAVPSAGSPLPPEAPRLTRQLTLRADGTVTWKLQRAIPGASVKDANDGYALKLRRDLLSAMEPARPGPVAAEGDRRAAQEQRRAQEIAYRDQIRAFRELRDRVRDLPEEFAIAVPPRVWAVYEIRENLPELVIVGPDESASLPWPVRVSSLEALRALASQPIGGAAGALDESVYNQIRQFTVLARAGHPLTHRAIAVALNQANIIGRARIDDPLYQLLQTIIDGPDDEARRVVVLALASTVPPSGATASLLRHAAKHVPPQLQLLSLRGLFQGLPSDGGDLNQLRDLMTNVNRALADDNGPHAGLVLEAMAEGLSPNLNDAHQAALVTGIHFDALPPERLDQTLAYIIRAAGTRPLAAAWLNHRLLGSAQPAVSRRTLELLSRAGGGTGVLRPVGQALIGLVSGGGQDEGDAMPALNLTLSAPILLDSVGHSLFRGINSGDAEVYELAWRALPNFTLGAAAGRGDEAREADEVTAQLVSAGLSRDPTPTPLVSFLAAQKHHASATRGLIDVVMFAEGAAGSQAARALLGSGRDVAGAVLALSVGDRAELAGQLYHAARGRAPLIVGLLSDPQDEQVARWFGDQVAAGRLRDPVAWAQRYPDEDTLLRLAADQDPWLAAGATAALVAKAGGDEATADELVHRFAAASDRSVEGLTAAWGPAKKEIYARRLAEAAGAHRLVVRVEEPGQPPTAAGDRPGQVPGLMVVTVGIVELTVSGQSVYLGNQTVNFAIPDDRLALRLTARDLKNLPNEQLADVPLEQLSEPVDLLPQDDLWRGEATLPDGSRVEIELQPVRQRP